MGCEQYLRLLPVKPYYQCFNQSLGVRLLVITKESPLVYTAGSKEVSIIMLSILKKGKRMFFIRFREQEKSDIK